MGKLVEALMNDVTASGILARPYWGSRVRTELNYLTDQMTKDQVGALSRLVNAVVGASFGLDPELPHNVQLQQVAQVVGSAALVGQIADNSIKAIEEFLAQPEHRQVGLLRERGEALRFALTRAASVTARDKVEPVEAKQPAGTVRVVVSGRRADGVPAFCPVVVDATASQVDEGEHYDAAIGAAQENGWEGKMLAYDEQDGPSWLFDNLDWSDPLTAQAEGEDEPDHWSIGKTDGGKLPDGQQVVRFDTEAQAHEYQTKVLEVTDPEGLAGGAYYLDGPSTDDEVVSGWFRCPGCKGQCSTGKLVDGVRKCPMCADKS